MKKTLTTLRALGNVKKQILAALLPVLACGTQAFGELTLAWDEEGDIVTITGDGNFEEVVGWFDKEGHRATWVLVDGATIHFGAKGEESATDLPLCGMIEMINGATFTFDELLTVNHYPNTDGPVFYTGEYYPSMQTGSLDLNIAADALTNWFDEYEDHSNLMESVLIDKCMFDNTMGPVNCTFAGLTKGETYVLGDEHYENVGIITDVSKLNPNEIALLYRPTGKTESDWVYGTFSLVAVGSKYEPVPEPATGTLSLLALAGLAARRRRK